MHTHTLNVDLSQAKQGENTYACAGCNQPVILVWNGYLDGEIFVPTNWGPRHEDANDAAIVNATINYVSN